MSTPEITTPPAIGTFSIPDSGLSLPTIGSSVFGGSNLAGDFDTETVELVTEEPEEVEYIGSTAGGPVIDLTEGDPDYIGPDHEEVDPRNQCGLCKVFVWDEYRSIPHVNFGRWRLPFCYRCWRDRNGVRKIHVSPPYQTEAVNLDRIVNAYYEGLS